MRFGPVILLCSVTFACSTDEPPGTPAPPKPAPSAEPEPPPTPGNDVSFESGDTELKGRFYLAADSAAPLLVLVHRLRGDRTEWAPLVERMTHAKKRYSIVWFDLRGHGA
jgi:pimeloyl-ACP methyl ester carboxylesterase